MSLTTEARARYNANRRAKYAQAMIWCEFQCENCGAAVRAAGSRKRRFCSPKCKNDVHNREWRAANAERLQEYARTPARRASAIRTATAHYLRNRATLLPARRAQYQSSRHQTPWASLINSARTRAAKKGLAFDLTPEWAASRWTGRCELTDIDFACGQPKGTPRTYWPTIDRIRPELGYVQGNCRFILHAVNAFKGQSTDEVMMIIATAMLRIKTVLL